MSSEKEDNMSAHILHPLMEEEDHPKDNNSRFQAQQAPVELDNDKFHTKNVDAAGKNESNDVCNEKCPMLETRTNFFGQESIGQGNVLDQDGQAEGSSSTSEVSKQA